jgi:predicted aspartyl protease
MVDVEVGGTRRTVALTAVLDTGFDGELSVPLDVAVTLGLELTGADVIELADGSHKRELLFSGTAGVLGKRRQVAMYVTESEDALVGTELLADCNLHIDFPAAKVRLSRKPSHRARG